MSELSVASRNGETAFDASTGLKRLVKVGYLPYIHTLALHLSGDWRLDEMWNDIKGFGHLPSHFWEDLESKCPRLRTVVLSGLGDHESDPWLQESGIYELKGMKELTQLGLTFTDRVHAQYDGTQRLLKNLKSLTFGALSISDTSEAMVFWRRHPLIEKLRLRDTPRAEHWFSETVEGDFLPNLKYLKASFHDVRSLMPILPRLIGLSVVQSLNAQVPYLLRCLIPSGLPNLQSHEIDQSWSVYEHRIRLYEGSRWYESSDGKFHTEKESKNAARRFTDNYIHSIARGAPNVKELCLHGSNPLHPLTMEKLVPQLAEFVQLKRLYFTGVDNCEEELRTQVHRGALYTSSQAIAEKCKSLERITDISNLPYLAVKIRRNREGEVEEVIPTEGYGMTIGSEDEAFLRNPHPIVSAG